MSGEKMHADEVGTDASLARRLLAAQFPEWADLRIERVRSAGTDHAIYRLGEDMVVRLPRISGAVGQAEKERRWLSKLAPHLPLAIPAPLAKGAPGEGYPFPWSVHRWLEGKSAAEERLDDPRHTAVELARFVTDLRRIDPTDGPLAAEHGLRGVPLSTRDAPTREAIAALRGGISADAATAAWEAALQATEWDGPPVWFHGDLLPGNLLVERGSLSAVIDFGGLGVGDPACDLMVAWSLFSGESRDIFRKESSSDDATWARGRGCALSQALIFIPYYLKTNPIGVGVARRALDEILADHHERGE